jgi:hypothetical protein
VHFLFSGVTPRTLRPFARVGLLVGNFGCADPFCNGRLHCFSSQSVSRAAEKTQAYIYVLQLDLSPINGRMV